MQHARSHHGAQSDGKYVVVADLNRNYTFATDPVCELLGYDRAMLLELRIDDIVEGSTRMAAPLFQEFVAQGTQTGRITLRHRSGRKIQVNYSAVAEPDGCVIAHWEPLESSVAG
jgi:PAS domain-containing protein